MSFPGKNSAPLPLSLFAIQPILALPEKYQRKSAWHGAVAQIQSTRVYALKSFF